MLLTTVQAWIGIGANLGEDPIGTVSDAIAALGKQPHCRLQAQSGLYRTAPMGVAEGSDTQPDYINAVVRIETALGPTLLLETLLAIEKSFGRTRSVQNAARTLDLDLLIYADRIVDQHGLQVPHPRMHERAFVLVPLADIDPDLAIPGKGIVKTLLPGVATQVITPV
ncbi:2-amino-4-hydroxy-6-hydroxymethyldihydropteridine diphosphokinase [Uliginosibacterium sp. H3]|uniref:2-amino-4-hydroxy-6-hydroxymethyldihydropteridine pyrophosphokinase n=1 Tax=Uliginosibacterium silvisoli TaxID=3114758 RepID=A0ABU6K546_9RHOO|nr:2-amino-4-hydroxy-6-hydroxymethyldihydropteridine diphosphokinase [Uliginosibacterium sp. H3]